MDKLHRAYGLVLLSDTVLPGLWPEQNAVDRPDIFLELNGKPNWVALAEGSPQARPKSKQDRDPAFILRCSRDGEFFDLSYSDGTRFMIDSRATRIWGTCPPPLTIDDLVVYLWGPVMGFVLRQRDVVALHGSSVRIGEHAVVLCGPSEAGKSTVAAALALRGFPILSDDIAALAPEANAVHVEPGYPRVCLWPPAVMELYGAADVLPRLTPTWDKRYLPLDGCPAKFEPHRRALGAIYILSPRTMRDDAPYIEALSTRDALLQLVQNTYMNYLLDRRQRAAELDILSQLVTHVPVRQIVPHCDPDRISALCDLIVEDSKSSIGCPKVN